MKAAKRAYTAMLEECSGSDQSIKSPVPPHLPISKPLARIQPSGTQGSHRRHGTTISHCSHQNEGLSVTS